MLKHHMALASVCFFLTCPVAVFGQSYSFIKIVDTTDSSKALGPLPYISDTGSVAFNTSSFLPQSAPAPVLGIQLAGFVSENGVVRQLGDPTLNTVVFDMNKAGTIVFGQSEADGRSRLLVDSAGTVTEIANTETGSYAGFSAASINNNGDIVFTALNDTGVSGIYIKTAAGDMSTVAEGANLRFLFNQYEPRINNSGTVSFSDIGSGGAVYLNVGGSLLNVTNGKQTLAVSAFSAAMVNADSTEVFALNASNPPDFPAGAIFRSKAGGPLEVALKGTGTLPILQVRAPTINDSGSIAYMATNGGLTAPLQYGVFVRTDSSSTKVIQTGDTLFGGVVSLAGTLGNTNSSRYLNSTGQVAFVYTLTNRTQGIALATPTGK